VCVGGSAPGGADSSGGGSGSTGSELPSPTDLRVVPSEAGESKAVRLTWNVPEALRAMSVDSRRLSFQVRERSASRTNGPAP
jgi:hypothetical protein